ncbi:glycosyltransferase family 2 protein [Aminobacter sp. BE322]|uniref:glycosyltransferase family 2 protein n=1 Tax=unclassified Aminobacter TaxID=2644704 RepID=UPI003D1CDB86
MEGVRVVMKPILSYCIPVQNRLAELEATLRQNLDANRQFGAEVEFVIANFGGDPALDAHVRMNFAPELAAGYLRIVPVERLDPWHFGRAKNVFRDHIAAELYSSLDADNFVSAAETQQILDLHAEHEGRLLIHHFSGNWGDGTCGRITLPAHLYRSVGYDERSLPRQYDEMDLILSALRAEPGLVYVSYFPGGALRKSKATASFLRNEGVGVDCRVVADLRTIKPLNPKQKGYIEDGGLLEAMQRFNRSSSFARNARGSDSKERYFAEAMMGAHAAVRALDPTAALQCFFEALARPLPRLGDGLVPVFACVKDDTFVLEEWYRHYRRIGCGPFFIVDDGSAMPVSATLPYPDVHVLTPRVGHYRTCKAAWLMAAMKAVLPQGRWALTIDADEFVDVPSRLGRSMADAAAAGEAAGWAWAPGLLVDMLPAPSDQPGEPARGSFLDEFNRHLFDRSGDQAAYRRNNSIRWAFGKHWRASYCIDARYRLAGTIDVLRKVPLVRYSHDIRLHHGFHDVGFSDATKTRRERWRSPLLLPMRHYKLVKLFNAHERERMAAHASLCFIHDFKTTANLRELVAGDRAGDWDKLHSLRTVPYDPDRFSDPEFFHDAPGVAAAVPGLMRRAMHALLGGAQKSMR